MHFGTELKKPDADPGSLEPRIPGYENFFAFEEILKKIHCHITTLSIVLHRCSKAYSGPSYPLKYPWAAKSLRGGTQPGRPAGQYFQEGRAPILHHPL